MIYFFKMMSALIFTANLLFSTEETSTQIDKNGNVHFTKIVSEVCFNGEISFASLDNAKLPRLTLEIENKSKLPVIFFAGNEVIVMKPHMAHVFGKEPRNTQRIVPSGYYIGSLINVSFPIQTIEPGQTCKITAPMWRWFDLSLNGSYEFSFSFPFSKGDSVDGRGFEMVKFDAIDFDL